MVCLLVRILHIIKDLQSLGAFCKGACIWQSWFSYKIKQKKSKKFIKEQVVNEADYLNSAYNTVIPCSYYNTNDVTLYLCWAFEYTMYLLFSIAVLMLWCVFHVNQTLEHNIKFTASFINFKYIYSKKYKKLYGKI